MSHNCDILIITPPRRAILFNVIAKTHPPLTQGIDSVPLRLAAVLEREFSVKFLPLYHLMYNYYTLDHAIVYQNLQKYHPRAIIIANDYFISNRSTACFPAALEIANVCKTMWPGVRVALTGKHAIVRPLDAFQPSAPSVDLVFTQEPEDFINDVMAHLLSGNAAGLKFFPGVVFRDRDVIFQSDASGAPPDVNTLPPPAYHLLREHLSTMLRYESPYTRTLPLTLRTSYGCPYRCPYCAGIPHWNKYRMRNAAGITADLDAAASALGSEAEFIFLDDEIFSYNEHHVQEIASVFAAKKIILEGALTHVNHFGEAIAGQIARFCRTVIFGAENFSDAVLQSLGKGQTREMLLQACRIARTVGLQTRLEFIAGLPMETPVTMVENLNFIYNALSQNWLDLIVPYVLTIHPGVAYCESPSRFGIKILHTRYEEYIEEGGPPAYETAHLNQSQIYLYYLLLQRISNMALSNKRLCESEKISPPHALCDHKLFTSFMEQFRLAKFD